MKWLTSPRTYIYIHTYTQHTVHSDTHTHTKTSLVELPHKNIFSRTTTQKLPREGSYSSKATRHSSTEVVDKLYEQGLFTNI